MNQGELPYFSAAEPGSTRGARPRLIRYEKPS